MIVTEPKGSPAPRAASRSLHPVEMRLCPESQDLVPESLAFPEAPTCEPRGRNLRKEDIAVEHVHSYVNRGFISCVRKARRSLEIVLYLLAT